MYFSCNNMDPFVPSPVIKISNELDFSKPPRLVNAGNTCFVNVVFQVLLAWLHTEQRQYHYLHSHMRVKGKLNNYKKHKWPLDTINQQIISAAKSGTRNLVKFVPYYY